MPRIRSYQTQVSAQANIPGRRATASDFYAGGGANAGRGLLDLALSLHDVQSRQEVSDVQVRLAKMRADWTLDLEERVNNAPPGDSNFKDKFVEDFTNYSATLGEDLETPEGQRAFRTGVGKLSAEFLQKAGLFQAKLAGDKAVSDFKGSLDAYRNTLLSDPSQFDSILDEVRKSISNPDGAYFRVGAQRTQLQRLAESDLAKSAVQGMIRVNPQAALDQIKDGKFKEFLDADVTSQLEGAAKTAIRAERLEQERVKRAEEDKLKKERDVVDDDFTRRWVENPLSVSPKEVANSILTPEEKRMWVDRLDRTLKQGNKIKTDPQTYIGLFQRIHLPDGDPQKLTDPSELNAYFGRGLDATSLQTLRGEIIGRRSPEARLESDLKKNFLDAAKSSITGSDPLLRLRDPKGDQNYQAFMAWFLPEYQRQRSAGKTVTELLDPTSKDYMGKAINQYRRSPQQFLKDLIEFNPSNPNALPGTVGTAKEYKSLKELQDDQKAGRISRERAVEIARQKGWVQ